LKRIFFASLGAEAGPYSLHVPKYRKYGMIEEPISDEWFKQILSERYQEIKPGVMGWKKLQDRNELLDLVIGNMAMMYMENVHQFDEYWWEEYEYAIRGN
jgi:phage terminase large subunit GpA-like protein